MVVTYIGLIISTLFRYFVGPISDGDQLIITYEKRQVSLGRLRTKKVGVAVVHGLLAPSVRHCISPYTYVVGFRTFPLSVIPFA